MKPTTDWLAAAREKIRRALRAPPPPEGPTEHCRNALMLLLNVVEEHPIIRHTCPEIDAAMERMRRAIEQLEGRSS